LSSTSVPAAARQRALELRHHGPRDEPRRGRAPGEVVVDVDHLVQRADVLVEVREPHRALGRGELLERADAVVAHGARRLAVDELQQGLPRVQVGEPGDPAQPRARAERDDRAGLASEQLGHLGLLRGADRAVDERGRELPVGERDDVGDLEVHRHRPEDDVHGLHDVEHDLVQVHDGLLAAAA